MAPKRKSGSTSTETATTATSSKRQKGESLAAAGVAEALPREEKDAVIQIGVEAFSAGVEFAKSSQSNDAFSVIRAIPEAMKSKKDFPSYCEGIKAVCRIKKLAKENAEKAAHESKQIPEINYNFFNETEKDYSDLLEPLYFNVFINSFIIKREELRAAAQQAGKKQGGVLAKQYEKLSEKLTGRDGLQKPHGIYFEDYEFALMEQFNDDATILEQNLLRARKKYVKDLAYAPSVDTLDLEEKNVVDPKLPMPYGLYFLKHKEPMIEAFNYEKSLQGQAVIKGETDGKTLAKSKEILTPQDKEVPKNFKDARLQELYISNLEQNYEAEKTRLKNNAIQCGIKNGESLAQEEFDAISLASTEKTLREELGIFYSIYEKHRDSSCKNAKLKRGVAKIQQRPPKPQIVRESPAPAKAAEPEQSILPQLPAVLAPVAPRGEPVPSRIQPKPEQIAGNPDPKTEIEVHPVLGFYYFQYESKEKRELHFEQLKSQWKQFYKNYQGDKNNVKVDDLVFQKIMIKNNAVPAIRVISANSISADSKKGSEKNKNQELLQKNIIQAFIKTFGNPSSSDKAGNQVKPVPVAEVSPGPTEINQKPASTTPSAAELLLKHSPFFQSEWPFAPTAAETRPLSPLVSSSPSHDDYELPDNPFGLF